MDTRTERMDWMEWKVDLRTQMLLHSFYLSFRGKGSRKETGRREEETKGLFTSLVASLSALSRERRPPLRKSFRGRERETERETERERAVAACCPPETDRKKKNRFPCLFFSFSSRLEQQHRVVAQVEVNKVLGLVRDVGS